MAKMNAKSPDKKKKSLEGAGGAKAAQTPKKGKFNKSINKNTPGKPNPSPPTPKSTPGGNKNANKKGAKKEKQQQKRSLENAENDSTPPKKLKKFTGTADLESKDTDNKTLEKTADNKLKKGKRKGQFFNFQRDIKAGNEEAIKKIDVRIKEISSRKELTKTARRKLKLLEKLKQIAENGGELPALEKGAKPNQPKSDKSDSAKRRERKKRVQAEKIAEGGEINVAKKNKNKSQVQTVVAENSEDSAEEEESSDVEEKVIVTKTAPLNPKLSTEEDDDDSAEEEESSESDYEVESEIKPDKITKTQLKTESDQEEDSEESGDEVEDDEEEESSEAEPEEEVKPKPQKAKPQQKNKNPNITDLKQNNIVKSDQKRYVLFVGNLPYDVTREELTAHFTKISTIKHIRMPTDQQTNKPRGFAYVEVENEESYQRGLSMHHTQVKGRRINVEYTEGGKKKGEEQKKHVKAKNFKLQAMRNKGQLAGSVKQEQKRSARRNKQNKGQVNGS